MAEKHKILVVDDETVIISSAQKILRAGGFEVCTAIDAESAGEKLRAEKPHIALVDLKLPGLSGLELLDIVKKDFPRTVVIMMTGYATLDNAVAFLKNGAFDFLPKPFTFEELQSTVQRASRFIDLPTKTLRSGANGALPHRYQLGMQTWAKIETAGTAQLGITRLFQQTTGNIAQVELPNVNDQLQQGNLLARLTAADEMTHTVWSALSGRVVGLNQRVQENPQLLERDPFGEGWLLRLLPDNLENEMMNLSQV